MVAESTLMLEYSHNFKTSLAAFYYYIHAVQAKCMFLDAFYYLVYCLGLELNLVYQKLT